MTSLSDQELLADGHRASGKVVLITGGANGIGRETALLFSNYGAKLVIGDIDLEGGKRLVEEISARGGSAVAQRCDVTQWEDVKALFVLALESFGTVDIVIPNAGVAEVGVLGVPELADGEVGPPNLTTLNVNVCGVLYACHLALYYMTLPDKSPNKKNPRTDQLKAIVMVGSMASWHGFGDLPMYTATKHAILGLMRGLELRCKDAGIRIGTIHPWLVQTNLVTTVLLVALAGLPPVPIKRVAATILRAATDPDPETSGCPWLLLDSGDAFRMDKERLRAGAYGIMEARLEAAPATFRGFGYRWRIVKDLFAALPGARVVAVLAACAVCTVAWKNA